MAASMNSFLSSMPFLPTVCSSTAEAECMRGIVKSNVIDIMTEMTERIALGGQDHGGNRGVAVSTPKRKKRKTGSNKVVAVLSKQAAVDEVAHLVESGMFGNVADGPALAVAETWRELCTEEFETFVAKGREDSLITRPVSFMLEYWGSERAHLDPPLARAARVLLSI